MPSRSRTALVEHAPAKVNLTLRVVGRRRDGYHLIESLVAFASVGDRLGLVPGQRLSLSVRGPFARHAGAIGDNLVLRAARALATEVPELRLGRFTLTKNLPAAAGLGGGSADAAAALRLLARANRLRPDDRRLMKVARALGADVPVCLDPRPRLMRGIGEILSRPRRLPALPVVLINPGAALSTGAVFTHYDRGQSRSARASGSLRFPTRPAALIEILGSHVNSLEASAIALAPEVATVLAALRASSGCRLARMSGSGATCFGLFASPRFASAAARALAEQHRKWWVRAAVLR